MHSILSLSSIILQLFIFLSESSIRPSEWSQEPYQSYSILFSQNKSPVPEENPVKNTSTNAAGRNTLLKTVNAFKK